MFTWGSIGIVDCPSLMNIIGEASLIPMPRRLLPSVPILTKDFQGRSGVRLWWHEEDFGMHLAVSCGSGDGGRLDFGTEYAAGAGLAEPDRVAVG